jgi:hypothetical protein
MIFLRFYRIYAAIVSGAAAYFLVWNSVWVWIGTVLAVRIGWAIAEMAVGRLRTRRLFDQHAARFKQQFGPYGIRLANKAATDYRTMKSLAEVFEPNLDKLEKNVEQLDMLTTIFNAGMRPEGDEYLLHDLKLKYGKQRLEHELVSKQAAPEPRQ